MPDHEILFGKYGKPFHEKHISEDDFLDVDDDDDDDNE
jgi:hypothetical protein